MTAITQVSPFQFKSKVVRAYCDEAGEPWFCATDVCSALGYANSRKAITDNCREAGVTRSYIRSGGQRRSATFINEGNLYRLIIKSKKEEAQEFESWVCDEVLPAIRKHGRYEDHGNQLGTLIGQTIGTDGFHMLGAVIHGKVSHLPAKTRKGASRHLWAQVHKAFSVTRGEDIPASQIDNARNFIGSYALEGEFIAAQSQGDAITDQDLSNLYCLLVHVDMICKRWSEYRVEDVLRLLKSPAAGQMCEHIGDARRIKNTLVRTRGDAMASARHRRGMSCNIHKLYG